jgi:glycosyltransferase involved in cell wall biosynthesis
VNVVISQEHRFDRTPDGAVWTLAAFPRSYYSQYLDVFDNASIVARIRDVSSPPPGAKRADGDGVTFHGVPHYVGPEQFLFRFLKVRRAVRSAIGSYDAIILRVQSQIAATMEPVLHRSRRPYALEVMCDPYEMFRPGANDHPLRIFFQRMFYFQMKKQCGRAPAVSYVTKNSLQKIYPHAPAAFSSSYSTVEMPPEAYVSEIRSIRSGPLTIITVGSLDQPYKGVDVLIDALATSVAAGLDLRLLVLGEGRYRRSLEIRASRLRERVQFLGQVSSGAEVRAHLDKADIFVLPSRTEGLPRAMIEAMARALPCLGSSVGGIPELLLSQDLVPPGDADALSHKIREVVESPERLTAMSARNLEKSQQYRDEILRRQRNSFYLHLKTITEHWLLGNASGRFYPVA